MRCGLMICLTALLLGGCTHIGPGTVPRDRFDYNVAIADSWKEQTLLNIVKLRYADMPLFVEVASVVSGYTLERAVNMSGTASSQNAVQGDFLALGTSGRFSDRPTITYAPITGAKFNESFMTPLRPRSILFMMQSGWPADMIFPLTVDSINGRRSRLEAGLNQREGDEEFYRVIELFSKVQRSGAVGMRVIKGEDEKETTVLFFYRENLSPEIQEAVQEVNQLLGVDPDAQEVQVSYGLLPANNREIAILTRSMLQIMLNLAVQIDVPADHVAEGRTIPSLEAATGEQEGLGHLITVGHGRDRPEDAFTAVRYRDYWFYIDDRDFKSKRTFAFLMILFSLTETGGNEGLPLVTIPAG